MIPSAANVGPTPSLHVVGFSGHRQLNDAPGVKRAICEVLESLRRETAGEWGALSSAAAGADLLFVRSAFELGMRWEASLPLPLVDFEQDFSPQEWSEVKALIARAERVEIAPVLSSREDSYLAGGLDVVNRCDVLLAVWDGRPARGKGGTAEIVAFARTSGRPVVIIHSETLAISRERLDGLRLNEPRRRR